MAVDFRAGIVAVAVLGVFYAALLALIQVNVRRLLAFAVVSHSGLLTIGLFSLGAAAFEGAIPDSLDDGRARFTPHSAFEDPNTPEHAAPRESIEVRTLVVIE